MKQEIETFINEHINPILAQHNGKCVLADTEDGLVQIRLEGGCTGCPGRRGTLLNGIRPYLMDNIKGITDVVLIEDDQT